MKQLLVEHISQIQIPKQVILESMTNNSGKLIVTGTIQRANVPNQNGRIYPKPLLERECDAYNQKIKERRAFGELDHPDSNTINLKNVSHIVTEVWWENDDVKGKCEVLDTPSGRILKELISAGCTVGISSRGLGSTQSITESDGDYVEVLDDFELLCWDFVSDPSTHRAYMLQEGKKQLDSKPRSRQDELIADILCNLSGICCIK